METSTVTPVAPDAGIGNLQRSHPSANSGRRRQQQRRPFPRKNTFHSNDATYTPEGHVETEEHGLTVDISA